MHRMTTARRRLGWGGVLLLLTLGAGCLWTVKGQHEISLGQEEIQRRIDRALDKDIMIDGPAAALLKSVRVKSATVALRDGKAWFAFDVEGVLRAGKSFELAATACGAPTYAGGALYFEPERIDVQRVALEGRSAADLAARLAPGPVAREIARRADQGAAAAAEAAIRRFLAERPVYRLKDDAKGVVMKAALERISVEDDRFVVGFSFWRLTVRTIAGFFSLLSGAILSILILRMVLIGEEIEISNP